MEPNGANARALVRHCAERNAAAAALIQRAEAAQRATADGQGDVDTTARLAQEAQLAVPETPVVRLVARTTGRAPRGADKEVGQLPACVLLAAGARVILTKNQGGGALVRFGLNNGASGTVVATLFAPSARPGAGAGPLAVVVDFPERKTCSRA